MAIGDCRVVDAQTVKSTLTPVFLSCPHTCSVLPQSKSCGWVFKTDLESKHFSPPQLQPSCSALPASLAWTFTVTTLLVFLLLPRPHHVDIFPIAQTSQTKASGPLHLLFSLPAVLFSHISPWTDSVPLYESAQVSSFPEAFPGPICSTCTALDSCPCLFHPPAPLHLASFPRSTSWVILLPVYASRHGSSTRLGARVSLAWC